MTYWRNLSLASCLDQTLAYSIGLYQALSAYWLCALLFCPLRSHRWLVPIMLPLWARGIRSAIPPWARGRTLFGCLSSFLFSGLGRLNLVFRCFEFRRCCRWPRWRQRSRRIGSQLAGRWCSRTYRVASLFASQRRRTLYRRERRWRIWISCFDFVMTGRTFADAPFWLFQLHSWQS